MPPTKFFHVQASHCKCKNFIHSFEHDGQVLFVEDRKADVAYSFFNDILGVPTSHSNIINLDEPELPHLDLSNLGERFTEEKVLGVIQSLPPDKAPGLDSFATRFLQHSWDMETRSFHAINEALMTLLSKKVEVVSLKDFRPISLIHIIGKLFSKVLTNILAPKLDTLVHQSQSVFIKGRYI
jgi:hypothetical protein